VVGKEEFNLMKTSQWNAIKDLQEKTVRTIAVEERLKLADERMKKLEEDNAKLRETVTTLQARVQALEKAK